MAKREKLDMVEVERQMVERIAAALHPIFYPIEQQDHTIQALNNIRMQKVARAAFAAFAGSD